MKKKLIVTLLGITVLGGSVTTAFADTINTAPSQNTKIEQHAQKDNKEHSSVKIRREEIVEKDLKDGKTVSQIKADMLSNLKANLEKRVNEKKIDSNKAKEIYTRKSQEIEKMDILNGVVKNEYIKTELNKGETLTTAKENFIKYKTDNINKLVSEKKLTAEQGKERISKMTERVNKDEGIFVNREEQIQRAQFIQQELSAGKTVSQIKIDLQSKLQDKLNTEVKDKKITSEQSEKIYKAASERIQKSDVLNGIVRSSVVKDALNKGETLSSAKSELIKIKTADINKLVTEKKITQEQATEKIANLTKRINDNEGIFIKY